jgi:hypothetical protein
MTDKPAAPKGVVIEGVKTDEHSRIEFPPAAEAAKDPLDGLVPGRIVHFWPMPFEARNAAPGPWPAMVTRVLENGVCTLNVNVPVPALVGTDPVVRKENVLFCASLEEPVPGSWTWMFSAQNTRYAPDRTA